MKKTFWGTFFLIVLFHFPAFAFVIFQDGFEYIAPLPGDNQVSNAWISHGWNFAKDEAIWPGDGCSAGAKGYLTTETSIPGYNGSFPGKIGGSSRVVKFYLRSGTCFAQTGYGQTDVWLKAQGSDNTYIPQNVWYQFWIYINHYGSEVSGIPNYCKLLYPSHDGAYPNIDIPYLVTIGGAYCNASGTWYHDPFSDWPPASQGAALIYNHQSAGGADSGINDTSHYIATNAWHLVKIHIDHTTQYGTYKQWIDGNVVINNTNENWAQGGAVDWQHGHRSVMLIPQWPGNPNDIKVDAWVYFDDFVIATTEADLPTYGQTPSAPKNVRIVN